MKKILFLILMTFVLFQGYSQNSSFGFGAGVNYTNLMLNNVPGGDTDFKVGMQFNAIFKSQLNNRLWLRFEPGFVQRGSELSYSNYSYTKINLNYLVLPVAFEFSPIKKFSVLFGPEFSYRLTAKAIDNNIPDAEAFFDNKFDLGVIAGVSYQLIDNLALELRYNRGFISTIKDLMLTDEYGNSEGKAKLCNQGITFSVVYILKRR